MTCPPVRDNRHMFSLPPTSLFHHSVDSCPGALHPSFQGAERLISTMIMHLLRAPESQVSEDALRRNLGAH